MRFTLVAVLALALPFFAHAESKTYTLDGMTCGSCVKSVKAQVCKLPGVETCEVEINKVTLTGKTLDDKAVEAAVTKAGYTMTAPAATPTKAKH